MSHFDSSIKHADTGSRKCGMIYRRVEEIVESMDEEPENDAGKEPASFLTRAAGATQKTSKRKAESTVCDDAPDLKRVKRRQDDFESKHQLDVITSFKRVRIISRSKCCVKSLNPGAPEPYLGPSPTSLLRPADTRTVALMEWQYYFPNGEIMYDFEDLKHWALEMASGGIIFAPVQKSLKGAHVYDMGTGNGIWVEDGEYHLPIFSLYLVPDEQTCNFSGNDAPGC